MNGLSLGDVATQTVVATKPSIWDQLNNAITKVAQPAANVYTTIKSGQQPTQSTVPGYTPAPVYAAPAPVTPAPAPVNNTKKYLLIGGSLVVIGGVIYLVTRKKGKK